MSAENNRLGFRMIKPNDVVEMSGTAVMVKPRPRTVFESPVTKSLSAAIVKIQALNAECQKLLAELEELCR